MSKTAEKKPAAKKAAAAEPSREENIAVAKKAAKDSVVNQTDPRVDKELERVREVWRQREDDAKHVGRTVVEFKIRGVEHDGDEAGFLVLRTAGGRCFVRADGEVALDKDGVADLMRNASSIFQAV